MTSSAVKAKSSLISSVVCEPSSRYRSNTPSTRRSTRNFIRRLIVARDCELFDAIRSRDGHAMPSSSALSAIASSAILARGSSGRPNAHVIALMLNLHLWTTRKTGTTAPQTTLARRRRDGRVRGWDCGKGCGHQNGSASSSRAGTFGLSGSMPARSRYARAKAFIRDSSVCAAMTPRFGSTMPCACEALRP